MYFILSDEAVSVKAVLGFDIYFTEAETILLKCYVQ